ncbi:Bug family tripartite tricarboxylate transporter substrate binding protein [Paraburkholderia xenovorans]
MKKLLGVVTTALCVTVLIGPMSAMADSDYPSRTIRIVVPFAPGAANDILARVLAPHMSQLLHQSVIVENRPGAGGDLGAAYVARQRPDGYILLLTSNAIVTSVASKNKPAVDLSKDLRPVALLGTQEMILVANPSLPASNIRDFIALAKAKPNTLSYGTPGLGTPQQLAVELIKHDRGLDILGVPFTGTAPALTEAIAGRVSVVFGSITSAGAFIGSRQLKPIGVTGAHRLSELPDVSTFQEAGISGLERGFWYGVTVPGQTPDSVVKTLYNALSESMKNDEVAARLKTLAINNAVESPQVFRQLIDDDLKKWKTIANFANIHLH